MMAKVLAVLLLVPLASGAAFMKYDGIDGEARDSGHTGEIDIHSWTFQADGGGASFELVKPVDASSPDLLRSLEGIELPAMAFRGAHQGTTYLKVELTNVMVTSYAVEATPGERPTEHISLNFEEIKVTYLPDTDRPRTIALTGSS